MALPKTTQDRIERDAQYHAKYGQPKPKTLSGCKYASYIAGAITEAERAQKLADALQIISDLKSFTDKEGFVKNLADTTLRQWNAGKEVGGDEIK